MIKVHSVTTMVFPVVMNKCESWSLKKIEGWKIDVFKLWSQRKLLRIPWNVRRSNHESLKEINSKYSLKGLMLKLKLQYFGHLLRRGDSLEKTLMLGNTEGKRRRGWQRMRLLDSITNLTDLNLSKFWETVIDSETWMLQSIGVTKTHIQLSH